MAGRRGVREVTPRALQPSNITARYGASDLSTIKIATEELERIERTITRTKAALQKESTKHLRKTLYTLYQNRGVWRRVLECLSSYDRYRTSSFWSSHFEEPHANIFGNRAA